MARPLVERNQTFPGKNKAVTSFFVTDKDKSSSGPSLSSGSWSPVKIWLPLNKEATSLRLEKFGKHGCLV